MGREVLEGQTLARWRNGKCIRTYARSWTQILSDKYLFCHLGVLTNVKQKSEMLYLEPDPSGAKVILMTAELYATKHLQKSETFAASPCRCSEDSSHQRLMELRLFLPCQQQLDARLDPCTAPQWCRLATCWRCSKAWREKAPSLDVV